MAVGERELVAAVLRRDRKATAEFVDRFSDAVYAYVSWRLAPAKEAAEDVVQEVFIAAWKGLSSYQGEAALTPWLLGIARHKVQDHYRKILRKAELPEDTAPEPVVDAGLDEALQTQQREEQVRKVLSALPESYRTVLVWRYWDAQSGAEIAAAIGRSEKAVERLLFRARAQFRKNFEDAV